MSSPEASKRPLENGPTPNDNPEAKRLKTEEAPPIDDEMPFEFDVGLLVQNALENFNEQLGGQTNQDLEVVPSTEPGTAGEIMDLDPTPGSSSPVAPVPFLTDPEKFIRTTNLHALGSLVRHFHLPPKNPLIANTTSIGNLNTLGTFTTTLRRNDPEDTRARLRTCALIAQATTYIRKDQRDLHHYPSLESRRTRYARS